MATESDLINTTIEFLNLAFCVNGKTEFVKYLDPTPKFKCTGMLYKIEDKRRGVFYITISKPV